MILLSRKKIQSAIALLRELVREGFVRFETPFLKLEGSVFVTNFYITGDIVNYLPAIQNDEIQNYYNTSQKHFGKLTTLLDLIDTFKSIIIFLITLIVLAINSISIIKEPYYDDFGEFQLLTRDGDIYSPRIKLVEPLRNEAVHFIDCVENRKKPISDGESGLDVVKILNMIQESLKQNK